MWRLLPVVLVVSCASNAPNAPVSTEGTSDSHRIVSTVDLPLVPAPADVAQEGAAKAFQRGETQGWVREDGAWAIRTAVGHGRIRCATYETGIALGQGSAGCSDVRWLTEAAFGTRQAHCNSATLVHRGGGDFGPLGGIFEAATCVRVVVRCEGAC